MFLSTSKMCHMCLSLLPVVMESVHSRYEMFIVKTRCRVCASMRHKEEATWQSQTTPR